MAAGATLGIPMATWECSAGAEIGRVLCHVRREVAHYERTTGLEIDECELSGSSRSVLDGLSPPRRAPCGSWSAGCEARGKAQGRPVPSGRPQARGRPDGRTRVNP